MASVGHASIARVWHSGAAAPARPSGGQCRPSKIETAIRNDGRVRCDKVRVVREHGSQNGTLEMRRLPDEGWHKR